MRRSIEFSAIFRRAARSYAGLPPGNRRDERITYSSVARSHSIVTVCPHPCSSARSSRASEMPAQKLNGKMEVFAIAKRHRIPLAPVRDVGEVMNDPHMHERGMLERIDHPELGEIVVPTTPLRLHGTDRVETMPSPTIGQHNAEIYGGWLGLSEAEIEELRQGGAI